MKTLVTLIALFIAFLTAAPVVRAQHKLTINIDNLIQRTGTLRVGLVTKSENFMGTSEIDTVIAVPAEGPVSVTFAGLPAATYAVQVYQDLNDNQLLDRMGMQPTEPFGLSNITQLMGPPDFEQAAFAVKEDTAIRVRLLGMN